MLKYSSKVLVQIVSCEVKIRTQVSLPPKPKLSPLGQPRMSQRASQAERIALAKAEKQETVEEQPGKGVGTG